MSSQKISPKDIENLANLARIKIGDDEKKSLGRDIDAILAYVDQLKNAPIPNWRPQAGRVRNVMRDDLARATSAEDRELLLDEAPHREGDYVAVKKIIAQD